MRSYAPRFLTRRFFRTIVVLAIVSCSLTPRQAVLAWGIGTPIVTYWTSGRDALTTDMAQQAVDGNYNVVNVTTMGQVGVAAQRGLRTMYHSSLLTPASLDGGSQQAALDALINQYKEMSGAYAYFLKDEPNASTFSDWGNLVTYLRQKDPARLAYINLYPNYASNAQLGTTGYTAYLNQYESTVNPDLYSYDHYQLGPSSDTSGYLQNLGLVATAAKNAGTPFLNIVQAAKYDTTMRVPAPSEMRFLVYSTLAHGAQGISYFLYNPGAGNGGLEPAADGTPTAIYTALTPLNKVFAAVAEQYKSLNWIGSYLKGYNPSAMPPGTTVLPSNSAFNVTNLSNTETYVTNSPLDGALIGLFDTDGTTAADATFALVVNNDYTTNNKIFTVTGPSNLWSFNGLTGAWTDLHSNQITTTLLPGGALVLSTVPEPSTIVLLGTGLVALLACTWRKQS